MQKGSLYILKLNQVVEGASILEKGYKCASQYMAEGHLNERAEGAENLWRLMEKVAIIVIVDLLQITYLTFVTRCL